MGTPALADMQRPGNATSLLSGAQASDPGSVDLPGGAGEAGPKGDYEYSLVIVAPPGRKGKGPKLSLDYSSAGNVHGGIAAGWSLSVPSISVDPLAGTVRNAWANGGTAQNPRNFVGPNGEPLVKDDTLPVASGGVGYRELNDSSFTRFEYLGNIAAEKFWWRAFRGDGTVLRFGLKGLHPYSDAPLVSELDGDGHDVRYVYKAVGRIADSPPAAEQPREFLLQRVDSYAPGQNPDSGGKPYTYVVLEYGSALFCGQPAKLPAVGSRLDYRLGYGKLSGTRKLNYISTWTAKSVGGSAYAAGEKRREYNLNYTGSDSCTSNAGVTPFRELASVQETVFAPNGGEQRVLPPTEFTYGKAVSYVKESHYQSPVTVANLSLPESIETVQAPGGCWSLPHHPGIEPGCEVAPERPGEPHATCQVKFCVWPSTQQATAPGSSGLIARNLAQAQSTGENVRSMLLDVNGDQRVDVLRMAIRPKLAAKAPPTGGCEVDVYLNKGSLGFVKDTGPNGFSFTLRDSMADVPVSDSVGASGQGELWCSLSRSFSSDASGGRLGVPSDVCSKDSPHALDPNLPASFGSMQQVVHGYFDVNADGLPDQVSQPIAAAWCPYISTFGVPTLKLLSSGADPEERLHWQPEVRVDTQVLSGYQTFRQKYWYVRHNTGNGFSETAVQIPAFVIQSPDSDIAKVPQPGLIGQYSVPMGLHSNTDEFAIDVTGDGYLDHVFDEAAVAPGKRGGGFESGKIPLSAADTNLILAETRQSDQVPGATAYVGVPLHEVGPDLNGDGLPDFVKLIHEGTAGQDDYRKVGTLVRFNQGDGFGAPIDDGAVMFSENSSDTDTLTAVGVRNLQQRNWQDNPLGAERFRHRSMSDLDYDGLADILYYNPGESRARVFLNGGRQWVKSADADLSVAKALGGWADDRGVTAEYAERADYRHVQSHQAVDVNGDGLLDLVEDANDDGSTTVRYARPVIDSSEDFKAPARLLRTVKNGYGAKTTVSYGRHFVAGKWVVNQVDTSPGQSEPVISTEYAYRGATKNAGPYGQEVFRGFAEVRSLQAGAATTASDDLTTVNLYSFSQDYRGALIRTAKVSGDSAFTNPSAFSPATQTGVMSLVDHEYRVRTLNLSAPGFDPDFPFRVVMPEKTISYACNGVSGQTAVACEGNAPSREEKTSWIGQHAGSTFVMDLPIQQHSEFTNGQGQEERRQETLSHHVAWSPSVFNVAPASTESRVQIDNQTTALGGVEYAYHDDEFRLLFKRTVTDPVQPDRVTRYAYYTSAPNTGQVSKVWQPEQFADSPNGGFSNFSYDPYGVHQVRVSNPVGHVMTSVVDLGTGATLQTQGPDYVCYDGIDGGSEPDPATKCTFDQAMSRAKTETRVDGLGRATSVTVYGPGDANGVETEARSYNDAASYNSGGSTPVSFTVQRLNGSAGLGAQVTRLDGLGRVVQTATQQQAGDRTVSYDYNAIGLMAVVRVPQANSPSATVEMRTTYDQLGRIAAIEEASASHGARILEQHSYNGLNHTVREGSTTDGSLSGQKQIAYDAAGQVVEVRERSGTQEEDGGTFPRFATTAYRYDGMGRVKRISDPDGVVTDMVHDYSGNRLSIASAGRTWSYGYDLNGNTTTVTEPVPAGKPAANYTHRVAYDDINRITKETPAPRDLTSAKQSEFKIGPKEFFYDQAHTSLQSGGKDRYQVGRLSYTTSPVATVINRYNEKGHATETQQSLTSITGAAAFEKLTLTTTYNATGTAVDEQYHAFPASSGTASHTGPKIFYSHDPDGPVRKVRAGIGSGNALTIADLTRNAAGVTTHRKANIDSKSGYTKPEINYTYDRLGRIESLQAGASSGAQFYKQELKYFHNGEIKEIREQLGGLSQPLHTTSYTYDHRHQLTAATQSGGTNYNGQFTYTDGGRLKTAMVAAANGARVPVRNVQHIYQNATTGDPQRLEALRKPDGTNLATYLYDEAGNTTSRALPNGTTITQKWDGSRLREVTKPNGEKEVYFYDGATRIAAARYTSTGAFAEIRRYFGDLEIHQTAISATKIYRQYIRANNETIARIDGPATTATIEHYLSTPQGHQALALAGNGTTITTHRIASYGPFGELLTEQRAQGAPANKYTREFNDKDYDPTAGLHYYGHRYYDPLAAQWTSSDPLYRYKPDHKQTQPRRANLYTYSLNNPIGMTDPNGLDIASVIDPSDLAGSVSRWIKSKMTVKPPTFKGPGRETSNGGGVSRSSEGNKGSGSFTLGEFQGPVIQMGPVNLQLGKAEASFTSSKRVKGEAYAASIGLDEDKAKLDLTESVTVTPKVEGKGFGVEVDTEGAKPYLAQAGVGAEVCANKTCGSGKVEYASGGGGLSASVSVSGTNVSTQLSDNLPDGPIGAFARIVLAPTMLGSFSILDVPVGSGGGTPWTERPDAERRPVMWR
ncbi:RHS repeat-associated core domain-containing protein [Streptomyces sp. NPDC096153]|uniref:RHS repeat-associated core domain-containing protein n=1 Tax=Streptomyces sp. NPDC096153 TaxID=3155548 RepID=UPI003330F7D1